MKNIWIPHVPKNGGTTLIVNLRKYCSANLDKFEFKLLCETDNNTLVTKTLTELEVSQMMNNTLCKKFRRRKYPFNARSFLEIKNKQTDAIIRLDHHNPLQKGMEDWIKILIIRDPIERYLSHTWHSLILKMEITPLSHLTWINKLRNRRLIDNRDNLIKEFDNDNVKQIFDYIYDITEFNKVTSLIEKLFLQKKINWIRYNTAEINFKKININKENIIRKKDLSNSQLERIKNKHEVKKDIKFYNEIMRWKFTNS